MDVLRSTCLYLIFLLSINLTSGQSEVEVKLITRDYVEKGSTVILLCEHNVDPKVLYKVAWLRNDAKLFEFIVDRTPPFRNFSVPGGEIDWSNSNTEQLALKNIDFEASGLYYCEVTTSTPIYTKASQDKRIHVILPQAAPPRISFSRRLYYVGEKLMANCTTSRARPTPSITWLINGKKVDDRYVRQLHPTGNSSRTSHRSKMHQQQEQKNASMNSSDDSRKSSQNFVRTKKHKSYYSNFQYLQNIRHDHKIEHNNHHNNRHENNHEIDQIINDNKHLDTRKNISLFDHKYGKYINEDNSTVNIESSSNKSNNNNNSINFGKTEVSNTTSKQYSHRGIISVSQLNIEVSELYVDGKDKLEITCLATIPAHVNDGEQFADYKTYSVEVNVENVELSSSVPSMSGMAAFGNTSFSISVHRNPMLLSVFSLFILKL